MKHDDLKSFPNHKGIQDLILQQGSIVGNVGTTVLHYDPRSQDSAVLPQVFFCGRSEDELHNYMMLYEQVRIERKDSLAETIATK